MANWVDKWRSKREARIATGEPLTQHERDFYKGSWGAAGRVIGVLLAKLTGRSEAQTIAERTGEKVGERVAIDTDRRIAEQRPVDPPRK